MTRQNKVGKNDYSKAYPSTKKSQSDYRLYVEEIHINRDSNGRLVKDIV
jgi:hypothetical protein